MKGFGSWLLAVWFLMVGLVPGPVLAGDEFSFFGGALQGANDGTFVVQMEYLKTFERKPFAVSISTIDEGHLNTFTASDKHHRDGFIGQVWAYHGLSPRISLRGGIGPYLYYDTQSAQGKSAYETGVAAITSADIKYQMTENWFVRLRANAVISQVSTQSVLFGVGRNLAPGKAGDMGYAHEPQNEISLIGSPSNWNIEYRRSITQCIEATTAYYDGNKAHGIAAEMWLADRFFADKLKIGIGAGPYRDLFYADSGWSGIVTAMARYAVHPRWDLVVQWDRVHTHYRGDTDVNSAGIGYKF